MKRSKASNYYELLEVSQDASSMDIINAYRQAKLTYKPDSLAAYSLFDEDELERIRADIEQAYLALSSPEKRRAYDAMLAEKNGARTGHPAVETAESQNNVVELSGETQSPAGIRYRMAVATDFSGALLREIREFKGIELATIAEHTKISRQYLQAIEEEDSHHLPEEAYLRGYLKQYAAEIGLDPDRVSHHYPPLQAKSD